MSSGRRYVVVAVLLATAALSGCGGDKKPIEPTSTPTPGTLTSKTFGDVAGDAVVSAGSVHAEMTYRADGKRVSAEGDVVVQAEQSQIVATVDYGSDAPDNPQVRLIDSVFYLNLGKAAGNKFIRKAYPPKGDEFQPYVSTLNKLDPVVWAKLFATNSGSVTAAEAPVTIAGVEARAFALEFGTPARRETITVYVSPDNLPRRVTEESRNGKVTIDYTNWGDEVNVVAPAKSELAGTS